MTRDMEPLTMPNMTSDTTVNAHLNEMRRTNRCPSTIYQRRRCIVRFIVGTKVHPLDATPAVVEQWISRPLTPEAMACELTHLNQFYKWCVRRGHLAENPAEDIDRPRLMRRLPRPIGTDDLARALHFAPDRIRPWLYLAAYAGLRAGEIAQLRAEAVQLRASKPVILVERSKGGGMSSVAMADHLVEMLDEMDLPRSGYLFLRRDGQPGPNKPWLVSQRSNEYLHSIGITDTLHSLRHWFGTQSYRASNRDLRMTQELMRHNSPISTSIYTWVDPEETAAAVQKLPILKGPQPQAA